MIAFPVAGRALDYLMRCLSLIRSEGARPIFVGSKEMLRQARAASDASAGEIVIADFSAEAIRVATLGEHPHDAVLLLLPEDYYQFIMLNRGLKSVRDHGVRCVFVTGREYFLPAEPIGTAGRIERPQMFALAGYYVSSQQFFFMAGGDVDYYEFGCFDGASMSLAFAAFGHVMPKMKFFGFDTFAGIARSGDGEFSFPDGDWAANLQSFEFNMKALGIPSDRLVVCPGDITQTASDQEKLAGLGLRRCAIAHIDCDVYEPAKAALNFLKDRMLSGGLILFDDWDTMDASDKVGERRAAAEYLAENPELSLDPYQNYGWHGRSFIFKRA